jgi:hypothetical protein
MLKVKTYLDRSAIHGIGLFAGDDIDEGAEVWVFNQHIDLLFTPVQWEALLESLVPAGRGTIRRYSYKENGRYCLCLDNAQFMNHSPDGYNVGNDKEKNIMFARVGIRTGEELLCNYLDYSDSDDYHLAFSCSSS